MDDVLVRHPDRATLRGIAALLLAARLPRLRTWRRHERALAV